MITHYDMTTGEVIEDPGLEEPATFAALPDESAALRLLTLREAAEADRRTNRLPADVAMLPVHALLSRWT